MEQPELVMKFLTVLGAPLSRGTLGSQGQKSTSWVLSRAQSWALSWVHSWGVEVRFRLLCASPTSAAAHRCDVCQNAFDRQPVDTVAGDPV